MSLFFTPLNHLQAIAVLGDKSQSFLQGQLTCDINQVTAEQSRLGAHCNPKGRVLISLRVIYFKQQYYLLVPQANVDFAIQQLQKYANLSRVKLSIADDMQLLGCWGEQLAQHPAFTSLPQEADQTLSDEQSLLIRERGDVPRALIFGQKEYITFITQSYSGSLSPCAATEQDWRLMDIENYQAQILPATRDLFTPQMLDYPKFNAVSFKKGCYIGQEIIARTHYLGKAKRHLHLVESTSPNLAVPGDKIHDLAQKEVGVVVEAIADTDTQKLLAVIQDEAQGQELFLNDSKIAVTFH